MAARGQCLFSLYIYIENFKNLLVRNHRTDFNIILQKYSFSDPLTRLFKPTWFVKKHGPQGAGFVFPIYLYRKLEKSSCINDWTDFNITWQKCFLGDPLSRLFKPSWFVKIMAARGGGAYFPYISIQKTWKNLVVRNHWTDFNITLQKCFLGDPLPRLFKP